MPFGLLLDLVECHKHYHGMAKPKRDIFIDDIIPEGIQRLVDIYQFLCYYIGISRKGRGFPMNTDNFNSIRDEYINARSKQRNKIVNLLEKNNFTVITRGTAGTGRKNYKGGGKYDPPHDLRHHKWIEANKNGVNFLISLNPYEVDSNSGNPHHLYDRIGVQAYLGNNDETNIRTAMIITKWSLPIDEDNGKELIDFLEKLIKMFQVWGSQ